jgi:hypothetical protein
MGMFHFFMYFQMDARLNPVCLAASALFHPAA